MNKDIQNTLEYREEYKKLNTPKYKEKLTADKIHYINWIVHRGDSFLFLYNEVWKHIYEVSYMQGVKDVCKKFNLDYNKIIENAKKESMEEAN